MSQNCPIYYGIKLGQGSYIENAHFEVLGEDPVPVSAGRIWFNSTEKLFKYSSLDAGGAVVVRAFASAEGLATEITTLQTALSNEVTRATTAEQGLNTLITNLTTALNNEVARATAAENALTDALADTDAELRTYVDNKVSALGSVFEYVTVVEGGANSGVAYDLSGLTKKDAGDYYKVSVSGWFKLGEAGVAFQAAEGDGIVFNTSGGVDKIDNTNTVIGGTSNFITVTGSPDAGYVVDVAQTFKDRVSTLEDQVDAATGDLADLTTTAKNTLVAAINEVDANADANTVAIAAEVTRATGAEATLQTNINTVASNLTSEVSRATAAEGALDSRLTTAEAGLATVTGDVGTKASLTTEAKNTLVAAINEVDANADANTAAIAAEVTRATGAEAALDDRIDALETTVGGATGNLNDLTTTAKNTLVAAINEVNAAVATEATRATTAEAGLQTAINNVAGNLADFEAEVAAKKATYKSTTPALEHTFNHGLNAEFINFTVLVKRDNGLYRNDYVSVEEVDANTIKVYISGQARDVKIVAEAL